MDLGIRGRHALICGGSKGLGHAAAEALALEGASLTLVARGANALKAATDRLSEQFGIDARYVAADVTTPEGRAEVLAGCPDPDILVTNPGVRQTPADFRTLSRSDWDHWFEAHCFSSLELIQKIVPGMCDRKFGRVVNISVSNIKFPQVNFAHSHAARVALSGAIASMVRELVAHNVVINSVLPGFFDTDALQTNLHGHAERGGTTYEAIVADRLKMTPAGRFASPRECGDLIAFLCGANAGYMTGQNIVNDGGVYQGIF
ncbi:SDR family oxidoreductase [Shinella sp.]|uniref:SDR family oxidoreductase n=1 Tax=Shinella sp. TaxID=1870904 RepID=UPI0029A65B61|nr:SDR family oxidoreductase [Shinella sp.]MDX3975453.1 SDR family oxidoreductase [Shinella sp.]